MSGLYRFFRFLIVFALISYIVLVNVVIIVSSSNNVFSFGGSLIHNTTSAISETISTINVPAIGVRSGVIGTDFLIGAIPVSIPPCERSNHIFPRKFDDVSYLCH